MNICVRKVVLSSFRVFGSVGLGILFDPTASVAQSESQPFAPAELSTSVTKRYYVPVPALAGETVEIWQGPKLGYILKPYVVINWKKFGKDVESVCDSQDDGSITVDIQFDSELVRRQAVDVLNSEKLNGVSDLSRFTLGAFPFASLRVVTGADTSDGLTTKVRLRLPKTEKVGLSNYTTSLNTGFIGTEPMVIEDTCDALRTIHSRKSIQAHAFVTYSTSKISSAYLSLNQIVKTDAFIDLLYDEKETGDKRILRESSSGGFGINVAGFSLGKSKSNSATIVQDTRRRAVTDTTLSRAIADASSTIFVRTLSVDGTPAMSREEVRGLVANFVMKAATPIRAEFREVSNSRWELVSEYGRHPLRNEDIDELIEAKTDLTLSANTDQQGKAKIPDVIEAEAKDKREQLQKLVDDIKWTNKGGEFIPVSVNLFQVNAEDLSMQSNMTWEDIVSTTENGLMFVDISVLDVERADFFQGFSEGFRAATPPDKIIFPLPAKLVLQVPFQAQPPDSYGATFACDNWKKGQENAMELARSGVTYEEAAFFSAIGCNRIDTPDAFTECAQDQDCEVMIREAFCMISQPWFAWWGGTSFRQNILRLPADYCGPTPPKPPQGQTAPYPGGPVNQ